MLALRYNDQKENKNKELVHYFLTSLFESSLSFFENFLVSCLAQISSFVPDKTLEVS